MLFYSASTRGFYDESIHGSNIPEDVVEISQAEHQALLAGQSSGKIIVPDESGKPVLEDPPAPTKEQLVESALSQIQSLLQEAALKISPLQDASDLGIATKEEDAALLEWKKYRVALNRVSAQEGFPETIEWPKEPE